MSVVRERQHIESLHISSLAAFNSEISVHSIGYDESAASRFRPQETVILLSTVDVM